jgi:hypothetical protein
LHPPRHTGDPPEDLGKEGFDVRRWSSILAAAIALAAAPPLAAQSVAGEWVFDVTLDAGSGQATFTFQVQGSQIRGTYAGVLGELPVTGTIEGNRLRLRMESADAGEVTFDGVIQGDRIEGQCVYGALGAGTFVARRRS